MLERLHTGRFLFTTVPQECPKGGYSVTAVHILLVPAHDTESSVN